jgi:two-component system, OmpR family, phosphate regulon sensor histidine kinase PhoR
MSRKSIVIIVLLAVVSLGLVIVGQVFWVRNAYKIQETQFNDRVLTALTAVVDRILVMNNDKAITEPVIQKSTDFFVANINDTPEPYLLETLLREEFEDRNLKADFEYGIYDCFNDTLVYGGKVSFVEPGRVEKPEKIQYISGFESDGHYFGVLFPKKTNVIMKSMDFWMYSSFVIFLIFIFFAYTIFVVLRQKKLSEVKTDFINNMTHELKTPISTIGLSADALEREEVMSDKDRLKRYASVIKIENSRLKSQVEKVLQIAALNPKKMNLKMEAFDVHEAILAACQTFRVNLEESGGELMCNCQASQYIIWADRVHFTNILYNLLDNATKYTDEVPHVQVKTKNVNDQLVIEFHDNGIGISPKDQKMIFDKFYRVHTGNVHNVKGFGLGLFYVKTVLKAHRGKITVNSELKKGSVFTIYINTYHGK